MLATVAAGATTYQYPDQLSTRVETDSAGNVTRAFGHLPFGETWYESGTASKWKFTSYERDTAEPQLDYAMNRSYAYGFGRFQSPDPYMGSMNPMDPQSMNRYAYVGNNPQNFFDPSGLDQAKVADPAPAPDLRGMEFEYLDILFTQINTQFEQNEAPTGPDWVTPGKGDPELLAAGCKVNIGSSAVFGDMVWCPGWGAMTFSWGGFTEFQFTNSDQDSPVFTHQAFRLSHPTVGPGPAAPTEPVFHLVMPPADAPPMDLGTAIFCAAGGDAELAHQSESNALDTFHSPEGYGRSEAAVWGYNQMNQVSNMNPRGEGRAETLGAAAGGAAIFNNFANCHP